MNTHHSKIRLKSKNKQKWHQRRAKQILHINPVIPKFHWVMQVARCNSQASLGLLNRITCVYWLNLKTTTLDGNLSQCMKLNWYLQVEFSGPFCRNQHNLRWPLAVNINFKYKKNNSTSDLRYSDALKLQKGKGDLPINSVGFLSMKRSQTLMNIAVVSAEGHSPWLKQWMVLLLKTFKCLCT